jgi:hypothetical protein
VSLVVKKLEQMSEGLHKVTITNVKDLGLQKTRLGPRDMAAIYFTDDRTDVRMRLVKSLHPESSLVKLLGALSVPFGETFDLTTLVGVKCEAVIQHKESEGKIVARVAAVLQVRKRARTRSRSRSLTTGRMTPDSQDF